MLFKKSIIIMGVAGSGKSTIGNLVAKELQIPFMDADDFHPEANKAKMAAGIPLEDEDRQPWLMRLADQLSLNTPQVLACSALKKAYRSLLDPDNIHIWVFLSGSRELLYERLKNRPGHYMKEEMLASQLETLEPPENAIVLSIDSNPETIVKKLINKLNHGGTDRPFQ